MNENMSPNGPVDPMSQDLGNQNPMNPVYEESTRLSKLYKVILGVMGFLILVLLITLIVYIGKANDSQARIDSEVKKALEKRENELNSLCEIKIKDVRENPWADFKARDEFGQFKFIAPRNWSKYEYFDLNANDPYTLYFSPDMVQYDSNQNIRLTHSALEVAISKKVYSQEINDMKVKMQYQSGDDKEFTEEPVTVSNFTGTKFVYKHKDLGRKIGVIILPYRDRALFIKTDDYDKWNGEYYEKFWKSFALTP